MSTFGDLNGSGNQQVWVNIWLKGQDQAGNYSRFGAQIRYYGNGYGSWTGSPLYWSISAPGLYADGSFSIPSGNRYDTYTDLWYGKWNIGHDANGYIGAFNITAGFNGSNHSSIGHGSAVEYVPPMPRIPKPASKPGGPTVSGVGPRQATVAFTQPLDNGGSAISSFQMLVSTNPAVPDGPAINGIGASPVVVTDLTPATQYYAKVRAINGSAGQYGAWSDIVAFRTMYGAYVGAGGSFPGVEVLVGKGGAPALPGHGAHQGAFVTAEMLVGVPAGGGTFVTAG